MSRTLQSLQNGNILSASLTGTPKLYFALILNSFRGKWSPWAGMGEQKTMLQHVEQTTREFGWILFQKLDSFWNPEIFYQEPVGSSLAKMFESPVMLFWNNYLEMLCIFLDLRLLFLKQADQRTEQNQCMMLYAGRGCGKHPTLIELPVGLLESRILLEEHFQWY